MKKLDSTKITATKSLIFYKGEVTKYHDYNDPQYDGLVVHFKCLADQHTELEPSKVHGHTIDIGSTLYEADTDKTFNWLGYM